MRHGFQRGWALALLALAGAAQAQIEITWSLAHNRTVLMEPILATVRIANYTGRDLDLSPRGNARLAFDVEDQPTSTVRTTGQPLVPRALIVPDGDTREVEVNLLDAYRIIRGQSYMLTPLVEFAGVRFSGRRLSLEIQPGLALLEREYGMRSSAEARSVSLRLIHRPPGDRLFFRIDNPTTGFCLGVYELGRVIRYFVPRLERDRDGTFHVLHQSGPDRFVHSTFDAAGRALGVAVYLAETSAIALTRGEDGSVAVAGGNRFEEDPENPGTLVAPALAPAHPYNVNLGELPEKRKAPSKEKSRGTKVEPPPRDQRGTKVK